MDLGVCGFAVTRYGAYKLGIYAFREIEVQKSQSKTDSMIHSALMVWGLWI